MAVDPRILQAGAAYKQVQLINAARAAVARQSVGGQGQGGRGVQVGPVGAARAQGQQVQAQRNVDKSNWQQAQQEYKTAVAPQAAAGGLFANPLLKAVTAPLQLLALPGKAVTSTVGELTDLAHGKGFSGSDWMAHMKDPTYGFGKIVGDVTGNEWLDRFIGLAGDVALDPLTWVAPEEKAISAAERASLATTAVEKGLGRTVAEAAGTGGSRAVRELGDTAAMKALGIAEKPGLKIGIGKYTTRIPLSGPASEVWTAAPRALRNAGRDTKLAEWTRKFGVSRDPELRSAFEAIVTGKAHGEVASPMIGAGHVISKYGERATERRVLYDFANEVDNIAEKVKGDPSLTAAFERGAHDAHPDLPRSAEIMDMLRQRQLAEGASVGELKGDLSWLPHDWLPEAKKDLGRVEHNVGGVNLAPEAHQFERSIVPGKTYTFKNTPLLGDATFTPQIGDAKEINDFWQRAFGHKAVQDDLGKILPLAVERAAKASGNAAYFKRAVELGFLGSTEHGGTDILGRPFTKVVPDKEATAAAKKLAAGDAEAKLKILAKEGAAAKGAGAQVNQRVIEHLQRITGDSVASAEAAATAARGGVKGAATDLADLGLQRSGVFQDAERQYQEAVGRRTAAEDAYQQATAAVEQQTMAARRGQTAAGRQAWGDLLDRQENARQVLADAEEVIRQRDMYRQRIAATVKREGQATGELRGMMARGEAPAPVSPPVAPAPSEVLPTGPAFPPEVAQKITEWEAQVAQLNDVLANKTAAKATLRQAELQRNKLQTALDQAREMFAPKAAQPAPPAALEAAVAPVNEAQQQLEALAAKRQEVGGLRDVLAQQQAAKAELDRRFAEQSAARPVLNTPEEWQVQQQLNPLIEANRAETGRLSASQEQALHDMLEQQAQAREFRGDRVLGGEPAPLAGEPVPGQLALPAGARPGEADYFRNAIDRLPPVQRAQLEAIDPLLEDATTRHVGATEELNAAVKDLTEARGRKTAAAKLKAAPTKKGSYKDLHEAMSFVAGHPDDFDPLTQKLLAKAGKVSAQLDRHDGDFKAAEQFLRDLKAGKVDDIMHRVANDGMQLMGTDRMIGRDLIGSDEFKRAMEGFKPKPGEPPGAIGKMVDEYTRFFKNYATAKPGFHIRNAMSATFMNLVSGTSLKEMSDGAKIWTAYRKAPLGDWYKFLPEHITPAKAEDVLSAVMMAGTGGQFSASELARRAYGVGEDSPTARHKVWEKLNENFWTKGSRNLGERVEGIARAGMALHGLSGEGGSVMKAAALIKKYHFDYSDVNEFDASLRRIVPFWTFMSRNLPLQIEQMYRNPRMYSIYNHTMQNLNIDPTGQSPLPQYLQDMGGVRLFGDYALAPDIGASQITNQLKQLQDPKQLLQNLGPQWQTPLELATNQNFFYGSQYKQNDFQKPGVELSPLMPLLQMLGLAQNTPQGPVVQQKHLDAINSLIPFLADVNRLGATTAAREKKGMLPAWLSFAGVPVQKASPESVQKSQQYATSRGAQDARARMKALAKYGGAV